MQTMTPDSPSGAASGSRRPWAAIAIVGGVFLSGVALSVVAAMHNRHAAQELDLIRFNQQADVYVTALRNGITAAIETVRSEGDFIRSQPEPTPERFSAFTRPAVHRLPQIHSMTWVQMVPDADRDAFEARLREEAGPVDGIWERDPAGEPVPAARRPAYYVVRFIEPLERTSRSLGFDTGSSPERLAALERARDTAEPIATKSITLMSDSSPLPSTVLFVPVYRTEAIPGTVEQRRANLLGFTTGGFRVARLVRQILHEASGEAIHLHLFDVTDDEPVGLASWPGTDAAPPDPALLQEPERGGLASVHNLPFAGRLWRVVAVPGMGYVGTPQEEGRAVLLAGLAFTALITLVLGGAFHRNHHLRRFAEARTLHAQRLEREIAQRQAAQLALAKANDELRQLNVEMEQFVSAASHDLKNPLLAIDWTTSALRNAIAQGEADRSLQAVETIAKAAASMRRIIDDLIAHARAGWAGFKPGPVDLAALVRSLFDERAPELQRRGVDAQVVGELPVVTGDYGRLTAALDNLVGNALKYGCNGTQPRIRIGCDRDGDQVRLYVEDNGPGVPREQRQKVFKLFHRIARDEDGTGIGLAIVDRVARAHHGRAWVEDAPDGGARFCLAFPSAPAATHPAPETVAVTTYN